MAHEIHQFDSMMYVGAKPWHGIGTPLNNLATASEAIVAANLGWTVRCEPVYQRRLIGNFNNDLSLPQYEFVALDHQVVIREDTNMALGVVGSDYHPFQNLNMFRFLDDLTQDPNGPKYETAGSLFNGRKVWALAKLPGHVEILGKDNIDLYLLISSSHDGSQAITIQFTPIRVVCNNTLTWALGQSRISAKFKHTMNVNEKVFEAADTLGIIMKKQDTVNEVFNAFAKKAYTKEQEDILLSELFGDSEHARTQNKKDEVKHLAIHGTGNEQFAGTFWGLYNGVTEFFDYHNNKNPNNEKAFESKWFGVGANQKEKAYNICKDFVGV